MIDDVDLVNMNGRVYDPALGRFLSADPFIHDVTNSQDLNRYSYVHNNPLAFVDQNGYGFFKKLGKFFKKIIKPLIAVAVAIAIVHFGPLAFGLEAGATLGGATASTSLTLGQAAILSGISGGVSNVILTGKPKALLTGFRQAVATFGVGHGLFGKTGLLKNVSRRPRRRRRRVCGSSRAELFLGVPSGRILFRGGAAWA